MKGNGKIDKVAALRQCGALNPRPQDVADTEFLSNEFFDPRDLVQVKYEMLRLAQSQGQPVSHAAAVFGFSRTTYYEAHAALVENGMSGLLPQRPGPRGAHKMNDAVMDFVEQAMAADKTVRAKHLVPLILERFGLSLHPRSIERALGRREKKRSRRER